MKVTEKRVVAFVIVAMLCLIGAFALLRCSPAQTACSVIHIADQACVVLVDSNGQQVRLTQAELGDAFEMARTRERAADAGKQ